MKSKKWEDSVIDKVRNDLRAALDDKEKIFQSIDKNNKRKFSLIEFKNALRKLGICISTNEID